MKPNLQAGSHDQTVVRFSTDAFLPAERAAAWREAYGRTVAKLEVQPIQAEAFSAEATLRALPGLGIVSTETAAFDWSVPRHCIDSDDLVLVAVETGRWACRQLGREVSVSAGEAAICLNGAIAEGTTSGRRLVVRVPVKAIAPMVHSIDDCLLRPIQADRGTLALLLGYARVLNRAVVLDAAADEQRLALTHMRDLFALLIGATRDAAEVAGLRGGRAALLRAIKADIVANIDSALSVANVASRHRIPVRYLQRLFEADGITLTDFILSERLARAQRLLKDSRFVTRPIASIAFEAGFTSQPYFNRAFRKRFGATPSDLRAAALRKTCAGPDVR